MAISRAQVSKQVSKPPQKKKWSMKRKKKLTVTTLEVLVKKHIVQEGKKDETSQKENKKSN